MKDMPQDEGSISACPAKTKDEGIVRFQLDKSFPLRRGFGFNLTKVSRQYEGSISTWQKFSRQDEGSISTDKKF